MARLRVSRYERETPHRQLDEGVNDPLHRTIDVARRYQFTLERALG